MLKTDEEKETVNLKIKNKQKLKRISGYENLNMSDMIDFLVENYEMGLKPHKKLERLQKKREEFSQELGEIDQQISNTNKQIAEMQKWNEQKKDQKENAVNVIRRLLVQKRQEEAEVASKNWATRTGIPATQLLIEASKSNKINNDLVEIHQ